MKRGRFERLVADALDGLPEVFLTHLENVEVLIEELPSADDLEEAGLEVHERGDLLGLYSGVPLTERDTNYAGFLPDRIILYQRNIEAVAGEDPDAVRDEVQVTVVHEIAHFFGISDERLQEMGWG